MCVKPCAHIKQLTCFPLLPGLSWLLAEISASGPRCNNLIYCTGPWPGRLTCADVLIMWVVLPMLIVMAGLWMHGPVRLSRVLRSGRRRWMLDLRLRVGGALRGDDPRRHEELVNGGTQVSHLGSIKRPVAELRLSHALLQT